MKKTLRNLVIYPLMAAALFFTGCNAKSPVQKTIDSVVYEAMNGEKHSSYNPNQAKVNPSGKGLDSYLFQGDELNHLTSSSTDLVNVNDLNGGDRETYEAKKISQMGIGEYKIREIEDYSKKRDLSLEVMEFKTEADKESYIEENLNEQSHFSKGNILAYFNPDFEEVRTSDDFTDGQTVLYMDLIKSYAKRTGLDLVLSRNKAKNQELMEGINEFINDYYAKNASEKTNSDGSIFQNTVSKDRIVISEGQVKEKPVFKSLDSCFFQGDESKFVKLAPANLEGFATNPGIFYAKDSKGKQEWVSKYFNESSDSLESLNILSTGSAVYTLPKIEKNSEEKEVILGSVEFESSKDMKSFLNEKSKEEGLISYPLFVGKDSISFISMTTIEEMENLSKAQQIAYMNLVLDYAERTGMKPVLSGNEKDSKILLERFKQYQR